MQEQNPKDMNKQSATISAETMAPDAYCPSLFACQRQTTHMVQVGNLTMGSEVPIRVQSMTTTDTNDVAASVEQSLRIVAAGGELVRLTTQGEREARSIGLVAQELRQRGCNTPLVADIHFNPRAAEVAAELVEAVRINPGNYTGEAKKFRTNAADISDAEWHNQIVAKLSPLVSICRKHKTAIRIGVNHGSLSDRIMARYGDTSEGMVASCIEYLDAFEELGFQDIVISIKSSNTRVMVQTVRLLAAVMRQRSTFYPLHLGVTEAGNDAEGRIKSAAGIGALLLDGLGDTIRVSLTEAPEAEIPVAQALVDYVEQARQMLPTISVDPKNFSPYAYVRRPTSSVLNIGGQNAPVLMLQTQEAPTDPNTCVPQGADWCLCADAKIAYDQQGNQLSLCTVEQITASEESNIPTISRPKLLPLNIWDLKNEAVVEALARHPEVVVLTYAQDGLNCMAAVRAVALELMNRNLRNPLVVGYMSQSAKLEELQLQMAVDLGALLIDGLVDGICVSAFNHPQPQVVETADILLQATRARFTRTEFISCPGCGRTLYDIQEAVSKIKSRLGNHKGLKIGVMGCIVNGIGEMADADYGYVGAGRGKISLYRGREVVQRSIDQEQALDALVSLIESDLKLKEGK